MPNPSRNRQSAALTALGRAIKATRLAQGITQEQLAFLAEVDRGYVGRVERGDNNVAVLTLKKLAKALGTTVSKLAQKAGI